MVFLTRFYRNCEKEKGQALLIVVLVIVVTLTVGLSLASRSIIQLRNTTDEANSQAAFSAAEAGVEQAIKLSGTTGNGVISGVSLSDKNNSQISNVNVTLIQSNQVLLNNGNPLFQDNGADIWLSPYDIDQTKLFDISKSYTNTLTVDWGTNSDPCQDPALQILIISGNRLTPTLSRYTYDQCGTHHSLVIPPAKVRSNNFSDAPIIGSHTVSGINGDKTFNYRAQINITSGLIARVVPLYHGGAVGVEGLNLPEQGTLITSTGTAGLSGQQVVRKVTFFEGHEQLPIQFYYSMFTSR